jgi:hypothetical protein
MVRTLVLSGAMLVGLAAFADEPGAKKGEAVKQSKLEKASTARVIDFSGSLKLSFNSLTTLGSRIDQARLAADPVALALAARELAVAEKVSGHKAALTAAQLEKEAQALARLRARSKELQAVALLVDDEGARASLHKLAQAARKREDAEAKALKAGEKSRGLRGTLTVINLHNVAMRVYTNGDYRGIVPAFQTRYFYVYNPPGVNSVFEVRYPDGSSRATWNLTDDVPSFRWTIDPNVP